MSREPINNKNKNTAETIDVSKAKTSPFAGLRREQHLRRLEPRIMFDGAAVATIDVAADGADAGQDASAPVLTHANPNEGGQTTTQSSGNEQGAENQTDPDAASDLSDSNDSKTFIFIDAAVSDPSAIIASADPSAEIYILDPASDGLAQIASVLANETNIAAVHIISHGNSGELVLGNMSYDASDLAAHAEDLAIIGNALGEDGDILLYGCNIASSENGIEYLDTLAALTGADIAASDDDTGASTLGGNWDLEVATGAIEAASIDASEWNGLLAPVNISAPNGSLSVADAAGNPTGTTVNQVGAVATWSNAGTVGSAAIDIRATILAIGPGDVITFEDPSVIGMDDLSILLNSGAFNQPAEVTLQWEIVLAGTTIQASGNIDFTIADIDGIGGNPTTRETVLPSLDHLTSYGAEAVSNIRFAVSNGVVSASGTQNQNGESTSAATFSWNGVSTWDVTYQVNANSLTPAARFTHDGDGDFVFANLQTTTLLNIDLDDNNSTAAGTAFNGFFTEGGAAVPIVDTDVNISQHVALGSNLASASVTLTNAQVNDVLSIGALPAGITSNIDTSVAGEITITFTGDATIVDYETALQAIAFENTSNNPDTSDRNISVNVTNTTFSTTSSSALSTISVLSINEAPAGSDNVIPATEDIPHTFTTADFGFSDVDGNSLTSVIITTLPGAVDGILMLNGNPVTAGQEIPVGQVANLIFSPVADINGNGLGSFTFQVKDNGSTANGGEDTDQSPNTISFNVAPVNDAPVAVDDGPRTVIAGTLSNVDVLNGAGADTDTEGDTLIITEIIDPANPGTPLAITLGNPVALANGTTIGLLADGTLDVTPPANMDETETFDYTISDGNGGTDTATVTVARDNDADGIADIYDIDDDNDGILDTVEGTQDSDGDGVQNHLDLDSDNDGISDLAESGQDAAAIDINNDGVRDDMATPALRAANDLDSDGLVDAVDNGNEVAPVNTDGNGPANFLDLDSDNDGIADAVEARLTAGYVSSTHVNNAGNNGVNDDGLYVPVNTDGTGNPDYLDTDSDDDTVLDSAESGLTPGADANGDGIGDGVGASYADPDGIVNNPTADLPNQAGDTSEVAYREDNANPVAEDDGPISVTEDTPVSGVVLNNNGNGADSDADGDPINVTGFTIAGNPATYNPGDIATIPNVGTLTIASSGAFTFTPVLNYNGPVPKATYTISDGEGGTDSADLTFADVIAVNDEPIALDDIDSTDEDTAISISPAAGLIDPNDTDVDGDTLVVSEVNGNAASVNSQITLSSGALLTVNADGSFDYDPNGKFESLAVGDTATETITYTVDDGNGGTDTATLTITVTGSNDAPVIIDPANPGPDLENPIPANPATIIPVQFVEDAKTITPLDITPYFADPEGDVMQYSIDPANLPSGLLFDPATGVISGTPARDASQGGPSGNGVYPVTIIATDPHGAIATSIVTFDITNPPPVAVNDIATVEQENPVIIPVLDNDSDPDGDPLVVISATAPNGQIVINPDGTITYQPDPGYHGPDTITYVISDGNGGVSTASVDVTINASGLNIVQIEGIDRNPAHNSDNSREIGNDISDRDPFEREIIHEFIRLIVEGRMDELELQFGIEANNDLVKTVQELTRETIDNGSTVREMLESWDFWRQLDVLDLDQLMDAITLTQDLQTLDFHTAGANMPIDLQEQRELRTATDPGASNNLSTALRNEKSQFDSNAQRLATDLAFG